MSISIFHSLEQHREDKHTQGVLDVSMAMAIQSIDVLGKSAEPVLSVPTLPGWGRATAIDLHHCSPERIRDEAFIRAWLITLCDDILHMRRFGEPCIVRFGKDPRVTGYSAVQLIETSNITAHFAEDSDQAFIDIFSCAAYDPRQAATFCQHIFGAGEMALSVLERGMRR